MNNCICPLTLAARQSPLAPAVYWKNRMMTFGQLDQYVWSTIKALKQLGVERMARVTIVDHNSVEYLIVLLALWRLGAVSCLFNHRLPEQNLLFGLQQSGSQFLFSSREEIRAYKRLKVRTFHFNDVISFDARGIPLCKEAHFLEDQDLTLLHTSGTSGVPKLARHTFGHHYWSALGANQNIPFKGDDRWLLSVPLFHVSGLSIVFRTLLGQGAMVFPSPEDHLLDVIIKEKVTHISVVSTQLYRLLQQKEKCSQVKSLKAVLVGGGPIDDKLLTQAIESFWPIYLTYGLTEMSSQVATSTAPVPQVDQKNVKVLPYRELKISPEGEILVKGKVLFKGYDDAGKILLPLKEDGWFATGDLGSVDQYGQLSILGRRDQMFICGGENVYPEEIEKYLLSITGIVEALVVGLEDDEFGVHLIAFIRGESDLQLRAQEILNQLSIHLPRFKCPKTFYTWPETSLETMKPSRESFKRMLLSQPNSLKLIF